MINTQKNKAIFLYRDIVIDKKVSNTTNNIFASNTFIFLKCENKTLGIALTNNSIGKASMPDIVKNKIILPIN